MRTYEVMTIHRPDLGEDEVESRVDGIATFLTERGASISSRDLWGKRRFAYEIDHLHDGFYSVLTFSAEPEAITELQRMLTLADEVVRHKIIHPANEFPGKAVAQRSPRVVAQPASEAVAEPADDAVAEPADDAIPEPTIEPVTEQGS